MILFAIEQVPFTFGGPELLFTGVAVSVVMIILGPRWLRQQRERRDQA